MNGHEQRQDTRWTVRKIATALLVILLLFSSVMFLISLWERYYGQDSGDTERMEDVLTYKGKDYVLRDGIVTFLVMGLDTYADAESTDSQQADFLLLLVRDIENDTCKAIQINRDTIVEMNVLGVTDAPVDTVQQQMALAHTYGSTRQVSGRNTADAVSTLLKGVEIDYYLSVTMDAVPVYNDLVGGVTLEVLDDFTDPEMIQGQTITLTGEQAFAYVRARKGMEDPTNIRRMARQKQYMEALYQQSRQCMTERDDFISEALSTMSKENEGCLASNCNAIELNQVLNRYAEEPLDTIYTLEGTSEQGEQFMEFHPDEDALMELVIACFYEPAE